MDASKITQLLQKQNTRYINRNQAVDSSTLIWQNQIQSSKYIKGVKTCEGNQNWNIPTNTCSDGNNNCAFGGSGRTTSIQTGSTKQYLNVLSGASGSASQIYSSETIILQKAGREACGVSTTICPSYIILPQESCINTNGPLNNGSEVPVNNQSNEYLPAFDTYYQMKHPQCSHPIQDQNQKHFVNECHTNCK